MDKLARQNNGSLWVDIERKILYSAYLILAVDEKDSVPQQLENLAKQMRGYSNEVGSSKVTIRVPSDSLKSAVKRIEKMGELNSKSIYAEDVTEQYFDSQIRLENAENARKRYLELLEQAENVEAALKVEVELERLNGEIDALKGQLNRYDHLATFSTISIHLSERKKAGPLGFVFKYAYRGVKWLFVRN